MHNRKRREENSRMPATLKVPATTEVLDENTYITQEYRGVRQGGEKRKHFPPPFPI